MIEMSLPTLEDASNEDVVVERVEAAARLAMQKIRSEGLTLGWDKAVPTLDQVRLHLAELVERALQDFHTELNHISPGLLPEDVVGESWDDIFEVRVSGAMNSDKMTYYVDVFQRLTTA